MRKYQRNIATELEYPTTREASNPNANLSSNHAEFQYQALMARRIKVIKQTAYFKAEHRGLTPGMNFKTGSKRKKRSMMLRGRLCR